MRRNFSVGETSVTHLMFTNKLFSSDSNALWDYGGPYQRYLLVHSDRLFDCVASNISFDKLEMKGEALPL